LIVEEYSNNSYAWYLMIRNQIKRFSNLKPVFSTFELFSDSIINCYVEIPFLIDSKNSDSVFGKVPFVCKFNFLEKKFTEFHKIHKEKTDDNFYFAIIGMEYIVPEYVLYCDIVKPIINDIKSYRGNENIHKYDSMSLAKFSARLKTIYNIARYELLRIAVDTGYSQGDYHTENLLLYEDAKEIMVIDFGNAKTIPHYTHLKNNWEYLEENKFVINKDTFRILKEILCDIYNTHYKDSEENSKEYQWLKHIDEEDMEMIATIHHFRLLKSSTPLHNSNVQRYNKNTQIFDMYLSAKRSEYLFQNMAFIDDDYSNHCLDSFWKKIFGKR
jgi:hypothetical protein